MDVSPLTLNEVFMTESVKSVILCKSLSITLSKMMVTSNSQSDPDDLVGQKICQMYRALVQEVGSFSPTM